MDINFLTEQIRVRVIGAYLAEQQKFPESQRASLPMWCSKCNEGTVYSHELIGFRPICLSDRCLRDQIQDFIVATQLMGLDGQISLSDEEEDTLEN